MKTKIRKSDMTIETRTFLIQEHMCNRVFDLNNTNDGKGIKTSRNDRTKENGQKNPNKRLENYKQRDN